MILRVTVLKILKHLHWYENPIFFTSATSNFSTYSHKYTYLIHLNDHRINQNGTEQMHGRILAHTRTWNKSVAMTKSLYGWKHLFFPAIFFYPELWLRPVLGTSVYALLLALSLKVSVKASDLENYNIIRQCWHLVIHNLLKELLTVILSIGSKG